MIKKVIIITFLLLSITTEAQYGSRYGSQYNRRQSMQPRQPRAVQQPRAPEINVEKAVGLIFYNIEKIGKKVGVKKSSDAFKEMASVFNSFNFLMAFLVIFPSLYA